MEFMPQSYTLFFIISHKACEKWRLEGMKRAHGGSFSIFIIFNPNRSLAFLMMATSIFEQMFCFEGAMGFHCN